MLKVNQVTAGAVVKQSIIEVVKDFGGFEKIINKNDSVLIKPNYNTADPSPASTAPDFLRAVVELCFEAGAKRVIVGESSTITIRNHAVTTKNNLIKAKVFELEKLVLAPEIMIFDDYEWVKKDIPNGKYLKSVTFPKIIDEVDKIILLPVAKTHFIAGFTGALKLAVGFMLPAERMKFHTGHVQEKVAEINTIYEPDLIIMDARKCFISGGPSKGVMREPGIIMASTSRVAIDIEEVKIIQSFEGNSLKDIVSEEMIQIKTAIKLGVGEKG